MTTKTPATSRDRLKEAISELFDVENGELVSLVDNMQLDKRSTPRNEVVAEVSYTDGKRSVKGSIINVSATGMAIDTNCPFTVGKDITLTFPHPSGNKHLKMTGKIIRRTPKNIAVRFQNRISNL